LSNHFDFGSVWAILSDTLPKDLHELFSVYFQSFLMEFDTPHQV